MTNKKKYLIIAAACIIAGTWFNHEEATGLEYAAALASVAGAAAATLRRPPAHHPHDAGHICPDPSHRHTTRKRAHRYLSHRFRGEIPSHGANACTILSPLPWHPLDHWSDHQHRHRPPPCSIAPPIEHPEGLHPWNEHPARLKDETPPPWIIRNHPPPPVYDAARVPALSPL